MATRFYLPSSGTAPASPAFDSGWEQTGQAARLPLLRKSTLLLQSALTDFQVTVPNTTSQEILTRQFVSERLPPQRIEAARLSLIVRCRENASTNNAHIAYSLRVINDDGTVRGTLASSFVSAIEFLTTDATRRVGDGSTTVIVTPVTTLPGDRLVLEVGVRANGPTAAGNANQRFGNNAASDFAFTSGLTTDDNPWMELSQDLWPQMPNNYQSIKVGSGMSAGERIR